MPRAERSWRYTLAGVVGNNVTRKTPKCTSERATQTAMPTIKEIRQLVETLNNDDLIRLCREEFPRVFNSFASGQSRGQQILSLVDFVDRQREIPKLVAAIEEHNLSAYTHILHQYI